MNARSDLESRKAEIACGELTYPSSSGNDQVYARFWLPAGELGQAPRAIVQIAHGMEEHIGRYDDFARFLAVQGYAVCGNDHIGHGRSVDAREQLSILPCKGASYMIDDVHTLRQQFSERFAHTVPYVIFGHSMGSFVLRCYLAHYGDDLAGAIICGTGQIRPFVARFGRWLANRRAAVSGAEASSVLLNKLADGSYSNKIPNARTPLDWLNTDPAQVDAYIDDDLCGVPFSVGGYASLMDLTAEACSGTCAKAVPDNMPVLFIAGAQDPVGDFGTGVRAAADALRLNSTAQVRVRIYEGMRHEILNEPGHSHVYGDVLGWLDGVVSQGEGSRA